MDTKQNDIIDRGILDFTAVDLETTGLSAEKDQIIEIGAVKYRNGKKTDTFSCFVKNISALPDSITELTGITDVMLADAPDEKAAIFEFLDFSGDDILLGHCISFDFSFLKRAFYRQGAEYERRGLDTLLMSRVFFGNLEDRKLSSMCSHYGIVNDRAHRAFSDAKAAAELYFHLLDDFYVSSPDSFLPVQLQYKIKKTEPATDKQKKYLNDLLNYHRIELNINWSALTKSEASRRIDKIILEYGYPKRSSH